ncbi:PIG-L deacetylase family protein [Paractinoplanes atraurantiacus]|uniref:N-acetylglucosaminyl deacetylase, LmbE family n=1 Tax=Paractinoplanes atraurantiacus TaxID=1036182 RepID=A0A285K311_9ACTN|nr:PIG-L family deacetylase [Actinoplanes atraurantiacus]SNY66673.1 N-acetylglucosaminyl deacetylase, LmbE family [Actinoplanes atraurantiacus]
MVIAIAGEGTAEATWQSWPAMTAWPVLGLEAGPRPPVVVAPHPDDEILGVAGLMATLGDVSLVAVTDGEASHPGSSVYTPERLAGIRRDETAEAMDRLGLGASPVVRLGQPDGGIDEAALADALAGLLGEGQWCLATWRGDGHPDHEAVGRAAAEACARTGARLLEYPIWTWHWASPGDSRVPWERARRVPLSPEVLAAKQAAIEAFPSQIHPLGPDPADAAILPPHVLARFARPFEVVLA